MGGGFARAVARAPGLAWAGVHESQVFSACKAGAGNPSRSRTDSATGGLFQPKPDCGRTGIGAGRGTHAGPLRPAGSRVESGPFSAGAGGGSQWTRLLAAGK